MCCFDVIVEYVQGKQMVVLDTLLKSPSTCHDADLQVADNITLFVDSITKTQSISNVKMRDIRLETERNETLAKVWGISEVLVSDNGTQFKSQIFHFFAKEYNFVQSLLNPHYPQASGEAESAAEIAKHIKVSTLVAAIDMSPSELFMGRRKLCLSLLNQRHERICDATLKLYKGSHGKRAGHGEIVLCSACCTGKNCNTKGDCPTLIRNQPCFNTTTCG
ncbi:unnamed protein product [Mytilus coruscus]|uniref:Integrase catalytic domain-containing protein n=1 Tax=Mytilus coruscus TaxID=42192 RepID=A0A6J8BVJ1_MYTCO|nr:unnamed protein product [Mytilus coruscus]